MEDSSVEKPYQNMIRRNINEPSEDQDLPPDKELLKPF